MINTFTIMKQIKKKLLKQIKIQFVLFGLKKSISDVSNKNSKILLSSFSQA